ncbi:MAG: hypothetical protein V8R46_00780 [Eubacterium ramulus]
MNDKELFKILSAIEEEHGIVGVHCENGDIIKAVTENSNPRNATVYACIRRAVRRRRKQGH